MTSAAGPARKPEHAQQAENLALSNGAASALPVGVAANDAQAASPATLGERFAAWCIDQAPVCLMIAVPAWALGATFGAFGLDLQAELIGGLLGFLASRAYFILLEASPVHATLGKLLLGIRVVGRDGEGVSVARSALRHCAALLSLFPFGLAFAAVSRERRALHDLIAGTCVVAR
jgi:uncharacterized RDD family membrane protein YckC